MTRMKMSHEIFNGKLMQSCPSEIRTFVMEAEKEKHQKNDMKAKKNFKNRNKPKADRAMKSEDHLKERIEWPKANSPEWYRLGHDISKLLKTLYSSPEKKEIPHLKIIYAISKERLGEKQKK